MAFQTNIHVVLVKNQPTLIVFRPIIQSHLVPLLFPVVLFEHEDVVIARMSAVVVYAVVSICVSGVSPVVAL